jgi:hypothetical protein
VLVLWGWVALPFRLLSPALIPGYNAVEHVISTVGLVALGGALIVVAVRQVRVWGAQE